MKTTAEERAKLDKMIRAATTDEWWLLFSEAHEGCGTASHNIVIGEQDDRVCEFHEGECKPKENAELVIAMHESFQKLLDDIDTLMRTDHVAELQSVQRQFAKVYPDAENNPPVMNAIRAVQELEKLREQTRNGDLK